MVDGKLSQWAYLSSVDTCYQRYKANYSKKNPAQAPINVDHFDYFAFHSPYNKLVQKGFGRLFYVDSMGPESVNDEKYSSVKSLRELPTEESYESRELEAAYRSLSNSRCVRTVLLTYITILFNLFLSLYYLFINFIFYFWLEM